jgi:hypothetical protein
MGRPKTRKIQPENELEKEPESGITRDTPRATTSDHQSESSQENDLNGTATPMTSLQDAVFNEPDISAWACVYSNPFTLRI